MALITGARLKVYINSTMVGEVIDFQYQSRTEKRAIYGIDATEPFEFAPGRTVVKGAFSVLRPEGLGSLEGYGMISNFDEHPLERYVSIMVYDRKRDVPVFQCDRAVILGQSWKVASRGIMTGTFEFEGFKWINEAGYNYGWEA